MGKKHGSLTRAGKVRKQTPKVDTKERTRKLPGKRYAVIIPTATAAAKKKFKANKQKIA